MMKIKLVFAIAFMFALGFSCSPYYVGVVKQEYYNKDIYTSKLNNIRLIDCNKDSLIIDKNIIYSLDRTFRIESSFKSHLFSNHTGKCYSKIYKEDNQVGEVKWTLLSEDLYWLDSLIIFWGYDDMHSRYSRKIFFNIPDYTVDYYKAGGKYLFLGQSNSRLFFESLKPNQFINETHLNDKGIIFSVNQKGVEIVKMPSDSLFLFFNNSAEIFLDPRDMNYIKSNYSDFQSLKITNPRIVSYRTNDTAYLFLDKRHLLRINENEIEYLANINLSNLGIEKVDDFIVQGKYLILSYFREYPELSFDERKEYKTENGINGEVAGLNTTYKGFLFYNMTDDEIRFPKITVNEP